MKKIEKSARDWQARLTPEQFHVCREKGTEPPFTGKYHDTKDQGVYTCVCCGNELFESDTKFDSGTGWPSFYQPIASENVSTEMDNAYGMSRVEVMCGACGSHLGHVFPDGPHPTRLRYCINSAALDLDKEDGS